MSADLPPDQREWLTRTLGRALTLNQHHVLHALREFEVSADRRDARSALSRLLEKWRASSHVDAGVGTVKADALSPRQLFDGKMHYEIPPFQRPYVWNEKDQWAPLWADAIRVAESHVIAVGGQLQVPHHFLGAVVYASKPPVVGLLDKPRTVGIGREAGEVDSAAGDLDEEQHVDPVEEHTVSTVEKSQASMVLA